MGSRTHRRASRLSPRRMLRRRKIAIKRYTEIVDRGGWPQIPEPRARSPRDSCMQFGINRSCREPASGPADCVRRSQRRQYDVDVFRLRRRKSAAEVSGLEWADADRHRRQAHDRALNVPADARLKQLKVNLGAPAGGRFDDRQEIRRRQHSGGSDRSRAERRDRRALRRRRRQSRIVRHRCSIRRSRTSASIPSGACRRRWFRRI